SLIDAVNRVAFAKGQIELSTAVERDGPWSIQRRAFERCAVWRRLALAGSCEGVDPARREIDLANAVIPDVADQQAATRVDRDAGRLPQLRCRRRTAIS